MTIYISGLITNPIHYYKQKFQIAEDKLRDIGITPINPFKLGIVNPSLDNSLSHRIKTLRGHCSGVLFLDNYFRCPLAMAELAEALNLKKDIYYEFDDDYSRLKDILTIHHTG